MTVTDPLDPLAPPAPLPGDFEAALSGGHPNSLGNTLAVVEAILADETRLDELLDCYRSEDAVVRLRVSSALKRVTKERPEWVAPHLELLLTEIAAIDQPSTRWTLATVFDLLAERMTAAQRSAATAVMQRNLLESDDWIVQNTTMQVLTEWASSDASLEEWVVPELRRLVGSPRKSV
ncbi:MAG: hypothetical protein RI885_952 [Actinomycetota bacterium]|jgi:HEAT repeat protein